MKPTDLRIGNLLYDRKFPNAVTNIYPEEITLIEMYPDHHGYKPIPLTEEWVDRFGFTKIAEVTWESFFAHKMVLRVMFFTDTDGIPKGGYWVIIEYAHDDGMRGDGVNLHRDFEYVHQLQNLWHSIAGEEIAFNSKPR